MDAVASSCGRGGFNLFYVILISILPYQGFHLWKKNQNLDARDIMCCEHGFGQGKINSSNLNESHPFLNKCNQNLISSVFCKQPRSAFCISASCKILKFVSKMLSNSFVNLYFTYLNKNNQERGIEKLHEVFQQENCYHLTHTITCLGPQTSSSPHTVKGMPHSWEKSWGILHH